MGVSVRFPAVTRVDKRDLNSEGDGLGPVVDDRVVGVNGLEGDLLWVRLFLWRRQQLFRELGWQLVIDGGVVDGDDAEAVLGPCWR